MLSRWMLIPLIAVSCVAQVPPPSGTRASAAGAPPPEAVDGGMAALVDRLGFDEALRRYGQPDRLDEADRLLRAEWTYRDSKRGPCKLHLSFNRKTQRLVEWSFGCP